MKKLKQKKKLQNWRQKNEGVVKLQILKYKNWKMSQKFHQSHYEIQTCTQVFESLTENCESLAKNQAFWANPLMVTCQKRSKTKLASFSVGKDKRITSPPALVLRP